MLRRRETWSACAGGSLFGASVSFIVGATLLEVSTNHFFATYFGILFTLVACVILWRVWGPRKELAVAMTRGARGVLTCLALVVLTSGISCFIVDHNVLGLSLGARVPLFLLLGMSVSFAVSFALVDVLNLLTTKRWGEPAVETQAQIFLVLFASVFTGAIYGLVFGLLGIEDETSSLFRSLVKEETISLPIGAVLGGLAGILVRTKRFVAPTPESQGYTMGVLRPVKAPGRSAGAGASGVLEGQDFDDGI